MWAAIGRDCSEEPHTSVRLLDSRPMREESDMPNTASRLRTRFIGSIGLATTIVVGTSLALGGTASAKTATVHFYSKTLFVNMYQADGQPVTNQNVLPVVGEYYTSTDIDYPGNNKHHGSSSSGYDHLVCTFTSVTSAAGQTVVMPKCSTTDRCFTPTTFRWLSHSAALRYRASRSVAVQASSRTPMAPSCPQTSGAQITATSRSRSRLDIRIGLRPLTV
jgi:hypothetical protein